MGEDEILGLPRILANAEGRKLEEIYRNANEGVLQDVELLQKITQGTRAAVRAFGPGVDGLPGQGQRSAKCDGEGTWWDVRPGAVPQGPGVARFCESFRRQDARASF